MIDFHNHDALSILYPMAYKRERPKGDWKTNFSALLAFSFVDGDALWF